MRRTLVLGIGNLLMGDEGVGVHALRALAEESCPEGVELLDGGTGGFHLLECFSSFDRIVLIDATMDGRPAGRVTVLRPRYASDFPRVLTAHDIGLRDLIESAALLGPLPDMTLITVSITEVTPMVDRLSGAVEAAIPEVRARVAEAISATPITVGS